MNIIPLGAQHAEGVSLISLRASAAHVDFLAFLHGRVLSLISAGYWSCWLSVNWKCAPVIWYGQCESAHIHKQPFCTAVCTHGEERRASATPNLIFHVLLYYVAKTALLNDDNTKKGLWVRSLLQGAQHGTNRSPQCDFGQPFNHLSCQVFY